MTTIVIESVTALNALGETSIVADPSGQYVFVKAGGRWRGYPYREALTSEELLALIPSLVLRYEAPQLSKPEAPDPAWFKGPMAHQKVGLDLRVEAACWAMMEVQNRTIDEKGRTLGDNVEAALSIVREQADKGTLGMYVDSNYVDWDEMREARS